jgi:hypothetical protein
VRGRDGKGEGRLEGTAQSPRAETTAALDSCGACLSPRRLSCKTTGGTQGRITRWSCAGGHGSRAAGGRGEERQKPALTESAHRDREHAGSCSMHQGRTMVGLGRGGREAKEDAEWPRRQGGDRGRDGGRTGEGREEGTARAAREARTVQLCSAGAWLCLCSCKSTRRTGERTPSWNWAGERMGEQGICRWAGEGSGQPAVGDGARRDQKQGRGLLRAHEKDDGRPGPGRCGEGCAGEWARKTGESRGGPEEGTWRAERGQAHVARVARTVLQVTARINTRIVVRLPQKRLGVGAQASSCVAIH